MAFVLFSQIPAMPLHPTLAPGLATDQPQSLINPKPFPALLVSPEYNETKSVPDSP